MKYLMCNHKMNLLKEDIDKYLEELNNTSITNCEVVIIPSYPYIPLFMNCKYKYGSQNVSYKESGALTGEVSAIQLKSLGCTYSLVGHSERRSIIKETDDDFVKKIDLLLTNDITPVFCIGETLDERDNGLTNEVLERQITSVFNNISSNIDRIIIAYEPVWSIGTGLVPTNEEINSSIGNIKEVVKRVYNKDIKVLYGGSVNDENISIINELDIVDGYLVGGASLKIDKVKEMARNI